MDSKHDCGREFVTVNENTMRLTLSEHSQHRFGRFKKKTWVNVCPSCDAKYLKNKKSGVPFKCADGVFRTIEDFDQVTDTFVSSDLDFCGFKFSPSALRGGMEQVYSEDNASNHFTTMDVEQFGNDWAANRDGASALAFSRAVCDWGGGQRVWANLKRRNPGDNLSATLNDWFSATVDISDDEKAIEQGTSIKGLAISFASKHLRMLKPERFAVLDSVLSAGLGFGLSPKGYVFFLRELRRFSKELTKSRFDVQHNLAKLEAGIFVLVRQDVRSNEKEDKASQKKRNS